MTTKALPFYQVDAFTDAVFKGNPAAVVPLDAWLPDSVMQSMAREHNQAETAFFVPVGECHYHLRWFTPLTEIWLCGHGTLASAHVVFNEMGNRGNSLTFSTQRKGDLFVRKDNELLTLDFPRIDAAPKQQAAEVTKALNAPIQPREILYADPNWYVVYDDPDVVANMQPDFNVLAKHDARQCVTAPGRDCDFVSRFFLPDAGIPEDPVTGSTHCALTPYWAGRLGLKAMNARQLSARGGFLRLTLDGDRVKIAGETRLYMKGTAFIPQ